MLAELAAASPHELVIFSASSLIGCVLRAKRKKKIIPMYVCCSVHVSMWVYVILRFCECSNTLGVRGVEEASVVKQITQRER